MKKVKFLKILFLICVAFSIAVGVYAQDKPFKNIKSQEVSEGDGIPVLAKHLPDWENAEIGNLYTKCG